MSARRLPRQLGVVIRCNGLGGLCGAKCQTANIRIRVNRAAAKAAGWIRGGRSTTRAHDYCPAHAVDELKAIEALKKARAKRAKEQAAESKKRLAAQLEKERVEAQGAVANL